MSSGVPEPKPGVLITLNTPAETPVASTPKIRLSLTSASSAEPKSESAEFPFPKTDGPLVESPVAATPSTPIKLVLNPTTAPAKEKKKKQPKAQARGLPDQDFKAITIVLQKLLGDKRSTFFRQPVDPTRDSAPDYLAIVTNPMDLSTIRAKLDSGLYSTRKEFESDVRLLISNCYLYNPVASPVRKSGEAFEKYFNSGELRVCNLPELTFSVVKDGEHAAISKCGRRGGVAETHSAGEGEAASCQLVVEPHAPATGSRISGRRAHQAQADQICHA